MVKKKKTLGRYIDPRTDFGFRWYFGREENKQFLIDFLNGLFRGEKIIRDLTYAPTEFDGDEIEDRRVVFDLHCIGADGEFFLVEMQQLRQEFFKDRAVYYTSRLISKQVAKGLVGNNFRLPEVYFIGVLQFVLDPFEREQYFYDVALHDKQTGEAFYDKLGYKMLVLPNFNKSEGELEDDMDQWLYFLKTTSDAGEMSKFLDKRIFRRIFELGEIANLNKEDRMSYEASLKRKMDWESVLYTARLDGHREGREEGRQEARAKAETEKRDIALKLKKKGMSIADIADAVGLSVEEIEKLT